MSDQNETCRYRYTVKRGDSFYLIAQRQGVRLRDLLEANPDIPPARLMVGDVLCIPYCGSANQPAQEQPACQGSACEGQDPCEGNADCGNNPPDAPGSGSSSGSGGQTPYVCPANRRAVVQEGQTASDLQIRYNLSFHTLKTANADKNLDALKGGDVVCIPEENLACPAPAAVTLAEGDTLDTVSQRLNVSVESLLRANPCLSPRDFTQGAVIRLPD